MKYEIAGNLHCHCINRFITVSFPDPYPDDDINIIGSVDDTPDDLKLPHKFNDRVYPDSRYSPRMTPFSIYIPCKEVMLKLMRACIKVKHSEDLWIFKNRPSYLSGPPKYATEDHDEHNTSNME